VPSRANRIATKIRVQELPDAAGTQLSFFFFFFSANCGRNIDWTAVAWCWRREISGRFRRSSTLYLSILRERSHYRRIRV